jgi:hypothetical protein
MVPCNLTLMGIEAVTKVEGALSVLLKLHYHPSLKSLLCESFSECRKLVFACLSITLN